jgi:large subunit ribosomal protein L6
MSRIGKKPIGFPAGVKLIQEGSVIRVDGPKGSLSLALPEGVEVIADNKTLVVKRLSEERRDRSYHGLVRTLLANMVTGVSMGFEKTLEISGVGYRAETKDDTVKLLLGYSGPVEYKVPKGITVKVDKQVNVIVSGIDKELVGRVASEIRGLKKPEPYKGKGIKYAGERIRRKVGKSVGA